jgi:hypothetical protein
MNLVPVWIKATILGVMEPTRPHFEHTHRNAMPSGGAAYWSGFTPQRNISACHSGPWPALNGAAM